MTNDISVPLKILQWNCASINTMKLVDLSDYITQNNVNIVCLQETNLHRLKKITLPGYKCYRKDWGTNRKGGGVAIFIDSNIIHFPLPTVCYDFEIDVIGVSINLNNGKHIKIKSFYNP